MLEIHYTNRMKRTANAMKKRGKDMSKLRDVLLLLASQGTKGTNVTMPNHYRDHPLKGKYSGFRECHIEHDWLLIYRIYKEKLILSATATGTHADLFGD